VMLLALATGASAGPVLGGGWYSDQINAAFVDSNNSPYVFSGPAVFRITDDFVVGDQYFVKDNLTLILVTSYLGAMAPLGGDPFGWTSASYQKGVITLGGGSHSLTIQGDGAGGVPAGFYSRLDRVDSVPDAGSSLLLFGMGLAGLRAWRRRD